MNEVVSGSVERFTFFTFLRFYVSLSLSLSVD